MRDESLDAYRRSYFRMRLQGHLREAVVRHILASEMPLDDIAEKAGMSVTLLKARIASSFGWTADTASDIAQALGLMIEAQSVAINCTIERGGV